MAEPTVTIHIDGRPYEVSRGMNVAAAMLGLGMPFRVSRSGQPRAALCGMGICYECRATVNGAGHRRTCMLSCAPDMEIVTR